MIRFPAAKVAAANDNEPGEPTDRRARPRRRALMHGRLAYVQDGFGSECTIRNLSDAGAMVSPSSAGALPRDPLLVIVRDGVVRQTRTVWRRDGMIGLAFVEAEPGRALPERFAGLQRL